MDKIYISRRLSEHLKIASNYYPVLSVGGPRQAGKSTILKEVFHEYEYISMEDPDMYNMVIADIR
jgi:predicted AAA+ superfamily ATPase